MEQALADQVLLAAYPDDEQRAHAARWLGWLAYRMGEGQDLAWWHIPEWIPDKCLRLARLLTAGAVLCACSGAAVSILREVGLLLVALGMIRESNRKLRWPEIPYPRPPRAIAPRWPRRHEFGRLALLLVLVVTLPPCLVRLWTVPAAGPPGVTYRTDRRVGQAYELAWALEIMVLAVIGAVLGLGYGRWLGAMGWLALGAGLFSSS